MDCGRKRNTHTTIYSVYIYICIFGELPLYMHCAAYGLYGQGGGGRSGITLVLAATEPGRPGAGERAALFKSETNTSITSKNHLYL